MPWAGGIFTRTNGVYSGSAVWQSDAAAAIKIRADRHDTHDQDLAQGINNTLTKDGQNSPNQNISWGGFRLVSLGNAVNPGDAVNKAQLDAGVASAEASAASANANANTRVLRVGDSMTGPLQIAQAVNTSGGYVRVANTNNGANAATGYYFGNDVDASFASYILKNSTGNASLGGPSSWNFVNSQAAPTNFYTNGVLALQLGGGTTQAALFKGSGAFDGISGIPATTVNTAFYTGGYGGIVAGRVIFGDGTGYTYRWSKRSAGTTTDIMTLVDSGTLQPLAIQPGATNFAVTNFVVSSSAPGALAQGVVYFRY